MRSVMLYVLVLLRATPRDSDEVQQKGSQSNDVV